MKERKSILRSSFFWKLYGGCILLILLATGIVGLLVARTIEQTTLQEIEGLLRVKAMLLREIAAPALAGQDGGSLQQLARRLGRRLGTRLTVIRADGRVIADSEKSPAAMDNHAGRPEIKEARARGEGVAVRMSSTVEARMMYLALPVEHEGEVRGFVRASLPLTAIEERLSHLRRLVLAGAAAAALLALIPGFAVAHRFTSPLIYMTQAAESIAAGNYHERVVARSRGELGNLGRAFNLMAGQLQERMGTITADRNKLAAILGSMVEGVIAVDTSDTVIHMNEAAGRLLETDPEESLGRPVWEIARTHEVSRTLGDVLRSGAGTSRELRITAGPSEKTIEVRTSPLRDAAGSVAGAVMVLHDISELRRLERIRKDFVANVSHELKTPITAIRGLVETLVEDSEVPAETRRRFLAKVSGQALRLSALVGDLLTLSRLEAREQPVEPRALDLRGVLRDAVDTLGSAAGERGIGLRLDLPEGPVHLEGDSEALGQAVANLLDNAIKYTDRGGEVTLCLRAEKGKAVVEVKDTGVGIAAHHLDRIFERFYRVDRSRSRELGGTGLGLAIVKHVALAHGGSVAVESRPEIGSTFRIVLPRASA